MSQLLYIPFYFYQDYHNLLYNFKFINYHLKFINYHFIIINISILLELPYLSILSNLQQFFSFYFLYQVRDTILLVGFNHFMHISQQRYIFSCFLYKHYVSTFMEYSYLQMLISQQQYFLNNWSMLDHDNSLYLVSILSQLITWLEYYLLYLILFHFIFITQNYLHLYYFLDQRILILMNHYFITVFKKARSGNPFSIFYFYIDIIQY